MSNTKKINKTKKIYESFGPNERAIIDKVKIKILKDIAIRSVGIKLQLQFKGWLQYLMLLPLLLLLLVLAGIIFLVGGTKIALVLVLVAIVLLLIILFDIITCKFRLRFPEHSAKINSDLDVFTLMRTRRSCRSYQTRDLSTEDMKLFINSVDKHSAEKKLGAASSSIRFEFISAPITVWPVVNARHFLVAIAPIKYDRTAIIDIGRSLQKIVIDATRIGLGTCWIGPGADHKSVIRYLGDRFNPEKDSIICLCAVGYSSHYIPLFIRYFCYQTHKRLPLSSLFFTDFKMTKPLPLESTIFKRFGRSFESCQWGPSSYNGQTTRCVATVLEDKKFSNKDKDLSLRFDFYAVTTSRYYAAIAVGIWCANWEISCQALDILGEFSILSDKQRDIKSQQEEAKPPIYDISWIVD